MEMACIAAIDDLAGDNELVLVVNDTLHIVACNGLVALAQKPCVRVGQGQLSLLTRVQSLKVSLGARALGHQLLYSRPKIIAIACVAMTVGSRLGFRCVIVFKRLAVSLDLPVQGRDLFGQPPARENARLAGVAMEQGAVDRNKASAHKATRPSSRASSTKLRFTAFKAFQFSLRKLAIVRYPGFRSFSSQISSRLRHASRSSRRDDLTWLM